MIEQMYKYTIVSVEIPLKGLTLPHYSAFLKPGHGFQTSCAAVSLICVQ